MGLTILIAVYIGVSLGRIPGLALDRVGVALLGAIAMIATGVLNPSEAMAAVHLPTILLLYALMVVSAQLRLGGFYTRCARNTVPLLQRPRVFLLAVMIAGALLSAVLANDIVCFAFTPVLTLAILKAGKNPLPYLLGLAIASNIGSAATIIGNPQNMLIGQVGELGFGAFIRWCGPPSVLALCAAYLILIFMYGRDMAAGNPVSGSTALTMEWPEYNRWQSLKGTMAVTLLVILFFTPIPREISALAIAGLLLCSRRIKTRELLGLVDWHLITLFCALFIVIEGVAHGGCLHTAMLRMDHLGVNLHNPVILSGVSGVLSNLFSNVPAVMILVRFLDPGMTEQWYTLAVSSTFAGNLFLMGSIANLIVVEQAAALGVSISFRDHARAGIPVTVVSFAVLLLWLAV